MARRTVCLGVGEVEPVVEGPEGSGELGEKEPVFWDVGEEDRSWSGEEEASTSLAESRGN